MEEIDFVITWVDGNDENWRNKKNQYIKECADTDIYYRDEGLLRYLLRSIDRYAPWVHQVYLVTDAQKPEWLNTECEKLTIVDHMEFIPRQYLPTFNSHTIELNLHRIEELAEQFVYFNDDFLLTKPCRQTDFFRQGKPVDEATLNGINGKDEVFAGIQFSNLSLMNRHYSTADCRKRIAKWLTPRYGLRVVRTLLLLPFQRLQGIYNPHGPMPVLKSTCQRVWERDFELLDRTCSCRERRADNVSGYIYRYEQLLSGNFVPRRAFNGYYDLNSPVKKLKRGLNAHQSVCINDAAMETERFLKKKKELSRLLEQKFPEKSPFEKK